MACLANRSSVFFRLMEEKPEMEEFCRQLELHFRTFRNKDMILMCGSVMELPYFYWLHYVTDYDYMAYSQDLFAIPPNVIIQIPFCRKKLIIHTEGIHAGYARLIQSQADDKESSLTLNDIRSDSYYSWSTDDRNHGPANKYNLKKVNKEFNQMLWFYKMIAKSSIVGKLEPSLDRFSIDHVYAVQCPYWPLEAEEWVTRHRPSGWPSSCIIEKVVSSGCHFVEKSHPSVPDDTTQWRFSFSAAENIIINSWNDSQKYVYHILRFIKREIVGKCGGENKTNLCSYFFKTLMLWECEERPDEFWEDEETAVVELLCTMRKWLIEKRCLNYFIRKSNMMDFMSPEVDCGREIEVLSTYTNCDTLKPFFLEVPKVCPTCVMSVKLPDKFILFCPLALIRTHNDIAGNMKNSPIYTSLFKKEVSTLLEGIYYHVQLMKTNDERNNRGLYATLSQKAECLLERAFKDDGERCSVISFPLSAPLTQMFTTEGLVEIEPISADEADDNAESHSCGGSLVVRILKILKASCMNRMWKKTLILRLLMKTWFLAKTSPLTNLISSFGLREADVRITCSSGCKFSSEKNFLTVVYDFVAKATQKMWIKPSRMISAAYLANFYYVTKNEYELAFGVCKYAIAEVEHLRVNVRAFPFVLRSDWVEIFDDNVQAVLGFVTLYRVVLKSFSPTHGSAETSWMMNTCVECFLRYIEIQSLWKLKRTKKVQSALEEFRKHSKLQFGFNFHFDPGHSLLVVAALHVSHSLEFLNLLNSRSVSARI